MKIRLQLGILIHLISIVDIEITSDSQTQIESYNDQYILSSFQDHVVAGGVFSFEYNGQNLINSSNSLYFKTTFESAGGMLFNFHKLINKDKILLLTVMIF